MAIFTFGLSRTQEARFTARADTIDTTLARIEAKVDAVTKLEQHMISDLEGLTSAVKDNIAAQKEATDATLAEDLNIEAAIAKLTAVASNDPAVQAQIAALQTATAAQRANTITITAENLKLATALGIVPPGTP